MAAILGPPYWIFKIWLQIRNQRAKERGYAKKISRRFQEKSAEKNLIGSDRVNLTGHLKFDFLEN